METQVLNLKFSLFAYFHAQKIYKLQKRCMLAYAHAERERRIFHRQIDNTQFSRGCKFQGKMQVKLDVFLLSCNISLLFCKKILQQKSLNTHVARTLFTLRLSPAKINTIVEKKNTFLFFVFMFQVY